MCAVLFDVGCTAQPTAAPSLCRNTFFSVQLQNISEQKKATDETWQNMQDQVRFASDS